MEDNHKLYKNMVFVEFKTEPKLRMMKPASKDDRKSILRLVRNVFKFIDYINNSDMFYNRFLPTILYYSDKFKEQFKDYISYDELKDDLLNKAKKKVKGILTEQDSIRLDTYVSDRLNNALGYIYIAQLIK